ncbi:MAG: 6-carboxytetrahydropterin synthase QueD [Chitinispirillaceae bacterium]|nr:6-carboxytetrahydropterin synthase QueD [Chitinispirillaceae bacterium]
MFEVTTETTFSAAHRLKNYRGPCENLHGHNWRVRATVKCLKLDECGIGIDFKVLKAKLKEIVKEFDHQDINTIFEPLNLNPSSENIARYIFSKLKESLVDCKCEIGKVEVFETEGNCAAYYE